MMPPPGYPPQQMQQMPPPGYGAPPPGMPGYGPPPGTQQIQQHTVVNQVHHMKPPKKYCGPVTCFVTFVLCFFVGPFALFSCMCPCDEEGGSSGYGHHRHHGGDGGDGNTEALLAGVVIGEALGGDGGDFGGDGGDFGGDGGDWGGDD